MDYTKISLISALFSAILFALFLYYFLTSRDKGLNSIKSVRVGDGQHGNAEWATEDDLKDKGFIEVSFPKEMTDMSKEWKVGRVLHWDNDGKKAWIDPSASHCATMAPTDVGKTTKFVVPNIMYNAMAGANMIVPDLKGELRKLLEDDLREKLNYNIVKINFSDVESSIGIDYLELLKESIQKIKSDPKRSGYWTANAETQAKILANQIQASRDRGSNENGFFLSASNGILTCILYLVALYGESSTIHFSSVRSVIQELGTARESKEGKSALQELLSGFPIDFPPRKLSGAAYSAPSETEANIYASALSDLDIYTNAMAEQVIATAKETFDWKGLVEEGNKTIVFIELPETRKDMFVFFTLFISQLYESLSQHAQTLQTGKLPTTLKIIWDEFGISPKLNDLPTMLNVSRGRGILFDIIYQSEDQLEDVYGKVGQQIVQKACNTNLYLGLAPKDIETAKNLSMMLGTYTIKSGSVSQSFNNKDFIFKETNRSISEQMQSKDLRSANELLRMGAKSILIKQNMRPLEPNNIPFYANEYPTKLIQPNDKDTKNQKGIIDNLIKTNKNILESEPYKKYISNKTFHNAENLINEVIKNKNKIDSWKSVKHMSFSNIKDSLKKDYEEGLKQLAKDNEEKTRVENERRKKENEKNEKLQQEKNKKKSTQKTIALGNKHKKGHKLIGWDKDIQNPIKEDTTFKAIWERLNYNVFFKIDNNPPKLGQIVNFGDKIVIPKDPERKDHKFLGWDKDIQNPIEEDTIFTAKWKPITNKVILDLGEEKIDCEIPFGFSLKVIDKIDNNNVLNEELSSDTPVVHDKGVQEAIDDLLDKAQLKQQNCTDKDVSKELEDMIYQLRSNNDLSKEERIKYGIFLNKI